MGSFTGAVPCQRVTQGYKGWLSMDGHHASMYKGISQLDCECDGTSRDESRS